MKPRFFAPIVLVASCIAALPVSGQDRQRPPARPIQEQIEELRQMIEDLAQRLAALEERQQPAKADPPADDQAADVEREFKNGKLAIGMTLRQVQQLAGSRGKMESTIASTQRYVFVVPRTKQLIRDNKPNGTIGSYLIYADFRDGKLIAFATD